VQFNSKFVSPLNLHEQSTIFISQFGQNKRHFILNKFLELEVLCISPISLRLRQFPNSSGTRQSSAISCADDSNLSSLRFLDNSSSFVTIEFKKVFQFHEFSELCSTLYFSGVRNFSFRYFGTFEILRFVVFGVLVLEKSRFTLLPYP
jgi:hypothetical protein